ncbi:MAG: AmmeMemoRadiSam system protein B [Desulfovibrionaceae bacterium]|nr:AmmeMemoRadiSam system protein B [Desulfovibrionaceae bacterium]
MLREAVVAGRFYPGNPVQAASEAALLTSPLPGESGSIAPLMMMLPHAGWVYSGRVAGITIASCELPRDLIILAPCHRVLGKGLGVWDKGAWAGPLGAVPVNEDLASEIIACDGGFQADYAPHEQDHSIEVLLPLLKIVRPDIRIVPVAVSCNDLESLIAGGKALARVLKAREASGGERPLLVVSSDMSHFVSDEEAKKQDAKALEALVRLDPKELYKVVVENNISMCGVFPATLALQACVELGAASADLLAYATSGQVSGDMGNVVGYAGVVVM